jgi:glucosamine--fructose-6-phosphate aminotransferase (isomerizing)
MSLRSEILEQPDVATRLLERSATTVAALSDVLRRRRPTFVLVAARGSSDHAALYAQYLFAIRNGIPVALATPSAFTYYGAHPRLDGALVLGISQSGRSPDIVAVLEEAARQGSMTLAITNEPNSPLARTADHVMEIHAGVEEATAATKTYTAELLSVALLSTALDAASDDEAGALAALPGWMRGALEVDGDADRIAREHAAMTRCVVLGRGYEYATAREWALKLQEMTQVLAVPYSAADFAHGPLALAEAALPVLAVATSGAALDAQIGMLRDLRQRHQAPLLVISDEADVLGLDQGLRVPAGVADWLAPLVSIIPAQLFAYHLAAAKGLDTERPRTITKVTETH